jgi:hypothetical protein
LSNTVWIFGGDDWAYDIGFGGLVLIPKILAAGFRKFWPGGVPAAA